MVVTVSGESIPTFGLGTATQGGLGRAVSAAQAQAVFEEAWDAGLRYYDTAPWYGLGQAEERLGEFLQGKTGYVLSTKVGRLLGREFPPHPHQSGGGEAETVLNFRYDFSYDGVLRSFEDSLNRMKVDKIDILFIHDPDVAGVSVGEVMAGAGRALLELREQGVVGAIGAGMNQWQMPLEFARSGLFNLFLLAGRYTLLDQSALPFMDHCAAHGVGVVIGGVYNSGLLADPRPGAWHNYAPVSQDTLDRALALQAACGRRGAALTSAAMQFPLAHPAVACVLMAARDVVQLGANLSAARQRLPAVLWSDLRAQGLLSACAPTPQETP